MGSYASKFSLWHAGVVLSLFQIVGGVGDMVFPYITGRVAEAWGLRGTIGLAAASAFIAAVIALALRTVSGERRVV
ncbi:MAG: hypothetical protein JXA87_14080 [Thermoleophilia bacterium]|nr:hypothetical protein [Thermoleophilia bacterium]